MTEFRSDFLRVLDERGFIHQGTDLAALDAAARERTLTAYVGYDCTADSLHIGNLVSMTMLRWFQKTGHRPITLMGGGTTRIGDPSGKEAQRQLLSMETIAANMAEIRECFAAMLDFGDGSGPTDAVMADNADWLDELRYIPFLRDVGRHFSINRMLTMDSVRLRLDREQPLSFLEFNYMILQAYDFVELNRRYGCVLQMGGSDQWGNIVNGVELARRIGGATLYGLTSPLIVTASGEKMGKTVGGAAWLNPRRLSPYEYWQMWRNTEDADVGRFLRLFTEQPLDEIDRLAALDGAELNEAKKVLANEATALVHGRTAADAAAATARRTFEEGALGDALPSIEVPRAELDAGIAAFALFTRAGLTPSNSEARRLIRGGGARLNDAPIGDETADVSLDHVNADGVVKLSAGRKRHALVRPV